MFIVNAHIGGIEFRVDKGDTHCRCQVVFKKCDAYFIFILFCIVLIIFDPRSIPGVRFVGTSVGDFCIIGLFYLCRTGFIYIFLAEFLFFIILILIPIPGITMARLVHILFFIIGFLKL